MPRPSIDTRNRKPRRTKGTPLYRFRNYVAGAVGLYTLIFGAVFAVSPFFRTTSEALDNVVALYQEAQELGNHGDVHKVELMDSLYRSLTTKYKMKDNSVEDGES